MSGTSTPTWSAESSIASTPTSERPSTPDTDEEFLFDYASSLPPPASPSAVLVTGGLGFIGSHTSLELLKEGYNVVIVDNMSNSYRGVLDSIREAANIHYDKHGGICPKLDFHEMNYRDMPAMRALLESYCRGSVVPGDSRRSNISGIVHFAAWKCVEESIRQPLKYYQNNINGLVDLLTLLGEFEVKNFIFSSSAAIYGDLADGSRPLREEYCVHEKEDFIESNGSRNTTQPGCTGITNPYGRTKFFGEAILSDLATSDPSWNIVLLRYFNPIGCDVSGLLGENPKGVPSNLFPAILRVMTGQYPELSVFGDDWDTPDGTAIRDFIHVSDLARGHIAALSATLDGCIRDGFRAFNLGTGTGYSVMEMIKAVEKVSQRPVNRKIASRRAGDVQASIAAVDRAKVELNWQTKEHLEDAVRNALTFLGANGMWNGEIR